MSKSEKKKILIIDDTVETIKVLMNILNTEYTTYFAVNGPKGLEIARDVKPDIVLLDIMMPEMNGYEVCSRLKEDPETENIPVIFVTAVSEAMDMAKGFKTGGVDYVTKPYLPEVVLARVATHLKLRESIEKLQELYDMALDANPMTNLPGNNTIIGRIRSAVEHGEDLCVLYTDLDNFKAYNDNYGFARGDEIILYTAHLLEKTVKEFGCRDCFTGHIGGDDFVLLIPAELAESIPAHIIECFDRDIPGFYSDEDRETGSIVSKNRAGETRRFPIMSISIAGVLLKDSPYGNHLKVIDACTDLKKKAKKTTGSCFCLNERRSE